MRLATVAASMLTWLVAGSCGGEPPQADISEADAQAATATPAAVQVPAPGRAVPAEGGEYRDIIVPELQAMLANKDFSLINVHVPFAGDLPNTDASIRYDEIASHLDQLPADKSARIVLYCRTGPMSTRAARDLVSLGYTDVYNLVGGFTAWVEAGLPLAQ
ncbi:MAG TPA: rhodanese-like domain-containing protein [Longimicrobiales bacterium]|nr:rhodanese-like domain-containing protein [Longimicrobiales bacterium]